MVLYKDMAPALLRAAHHEARINVQNAKEAVDRGVQAGLPADHMRSAQTLEHWTKQKRIIEGVARKRGIAL